MKIQSHAFVALMSLCMLGISGQVYAKQVGPKFTVVGVSTYNDYRAFQRASDEGVKKCKPQGLQFFYTNVKHSTFKVIGTLWYRVEMKGYCKTYTNSINPEG